MLVVMSVAVVRVLLLLLVVVVVLLLVVVVLLLLLWFVLKVESAWKFASQKSMEIMVGPAVPSHVNLTHHCISCRGPV